jgi:hypothetical protein
VDQHENGLEVAESQPGAPERYTAIDQSQSSQQYYAKHFYDLQIMIRKQQFSLENIVFRK